jgi:transposase
MTAPVAVASEILRLHYAEHWRVGTIAAQLEVHPDVVRRVLGHADRRAPARPRPRLVDAFRPLALDLLTRFPRLRSTALFDMMRRRGFTGSERTVRSFAATIRPPRRREVFLLTETLPGEQAQVDWAYVGNIAVPGGERALWIFVLVLSHSRAMWGEFVIDLTVHSLCRSLVRAGEALGGVPRRWLFDNPKTIVLEKSHGAVRFHPTLLALAGAMRVEPTLCTVRKPNQKGKVERAIRYLRDRFLAGQTFHSIEEGNRAFRRFLAEVAHLRPHPVLPQRTVGEAYDAERPRLLALPTPPPETARVEPAPVDRQAFVRVDTNRYSVPTDHGDTVRTLVVDDEQVRVLDGQTVIAAHPRSWGRRQVIEDPAHRVALVAERRAARALKGRDRLRAIAPTFDRIVARWDTVGASLGHRVCKAIRLLDLYGDHVFAAAVVDLDARGLADLGALAVACERQRKLAGRPVPLDLVLPAHLDDAEVIPRDLGTYDE